MKIFVTGFHRAGTHSIAEDIAQKNGLLYFEEGRIRWDSLEAAEMLCNGLSPSWKVVDGKMTLKGYRDPMLKKGFVLQCPGLAHKTIQLAELGEVHWCVRDRVAIATSMFQQDFNEMTWHLMNQFHDEFPDDGIWQDLQYDGSEDVKFGFISYHSLFVKVKDYFYEKYFKNITALVQLEDQPFCDASKSSAIKNPLRADLKERLLYVG